MNKHSFPLVTIIIPCRNEVEYIGTFLDSIFSQDYPREKVEVIVSDGMSDDGTFTKLKVIANEHSNLKILINESKTTPHGLNIAIKNASGEVILRMDCHAIYPTNYISLLVSALLEKNVDNVGLSLETLPGVNTAIGWGIAMAFSSPVAVGASQFRTSNPNSSIYVDTVPFGCFRRELFDRVGFYSEKLIRNQDDELNSRIIKNGGKILLLPHFRIQYFARKNLNQVWQMFFQYGLYKPLSNKIAGRMSSIRQIAPIFFQFFMLILVLISFFNFNSLLVFFASLCVYLSIIVFYAAKAVLNTSVSNKVSTAYYFVASVIIIHQSYGYGYFLGFLNLISGKELSNIKISR